MAEPFLGEIRLLSFIFPPKGWALCNGQILPINQNQALFSLLGTQYGGDGRVNFALPNLQGRTPIHRGNGHVMGESGGAATHTLSLAEVPKHTHRWRASSTQGTEFEPQGRVLAARKLYVSGSPDTSLAKAAVASAGGSQPHENIAPYLTLSYCIALQGIFPPRD